MNVLVEVGEYQKYCCRKSNLMRKSGEKIEGKEEHMDDRVSIQ
jgi:hypothetical protein